MMERKRILIIGAVALVLVSLVAGFLLFNKKKESSEQIIPKPAKKQSIQITPPDIVFPTYTYDAHTLRDPFAPLIVKKQKRKGLSPVEGYDIEELKLTGIAWDKKGSYALLQAPDGRFYVVRENDKIGFGGGRITRILKDRVEIKEGKKVKYLKLKVEEEK